MINKKEKKIIKSIDNIDNYLKIDNIFHNVSIIINFELLTITIINYIIIIIIYLFFT